MDACQLPRSPPSLPRSATGSRRAFAGPTAAQAQAWPAIATGEHALISAPTGSGKTLAAFLWALDRFVAEPLARAHAARLRLPAEGALLRRREEPARAAARDRRGPQRGDPHRRHAAEGAARHGPPPAGHPDHHAGVAVPDAHQPGARDLLRDRAGDRRRDPRRRADEARRAPRGDARAARRAGRARRAADRADRRRRTRWRRSGASSSARGRTCTIVDTGARKPLDLKIHVPVESMVEPEQSDLELDPFAGQEATRKSIWPAIYPELLALVREHRSTIVFVNNRRAAERLALRLNELAEEPIARAHHGSLAREERSSSRSSSRPASCRASSRPRRWSSASTWAPSTSCCRSSRRSR